MDVVNAGCDIDSYTIFVTFSQKCQGLKVFFGGGGKPGKWMILLNIYDINSMPNVAASCFCNK